MKMEKKRKKHGIQITGIPESGMQVQLEYKVWCKVCVRINDTFNFPPAPYGQELTSPYMSED